MKYVLFRTYVYRGKDRSYLSSLQASELSTIRFMVTRALKAEGSKKLPVDYQFSLNYLRNRNL